MRNDLPVPTGRNPRPVNRLIEDSKIETLLQEEEGFILGRCGDQLLRYKTDTHLVTFGPTGAGKGTGVVIPNLMDHPGSAFVIDIKGETVAKTAEARRHLGQRVVVLDPYDFTKGQWGRDNYNPFDLFFSSSSKQEAGGRINRLVKSIMHDPAGRMSKEPIWDNATKELLQAFLHLCLWYWEPYRQNLLEVYKILLYTEAEMECFIAELKGRIENDPKAKEDITLKGLITILTESRGKTSITDNAVIQARTLLQWMKEEHFQKITQDSTFSFADMQGNQKITVYLIISDEFIEDCPIWVRMILESAVFSQKVRQKATAHLEQKDRVLFLLDEVAQFGKLDIVGEGTSTLRGRGVNLWLFLQNMGQLTDTYGEDGAQTVLGNSAVVQGFGFDKSKDLKYFVEEIGEEFFDVATVSVGITETQSESRSYGSSETFNSSKSISEQIGESDTTGRTVTKNRGYAYGYGSGYNSGERNRLTSTRTRNSSENYNRGKSDASMQSHMASRTTGTTGQSGRSWGTTETTTNQTSTALMHQVSVTRQRISIETTRSVREKFNEGKQFLQIKKHQPFFCHLSYYFVRFTDSNRYVFPDMAAMAETGIFEEISKREALTQPLQLDMSAFESDITLKNAQMLKLPDAQDGKDALALLEDFRRFLSDDIFAIKEKFKELENQLFDHRDALGEIAIASLGLISAMQRFGVPEFNEKDEELLDHMQRVEEVAAQDTPLGGDFFEKYKGMKLLDESFDLSSLNPSQGEFLMPRYKAIIEKFKVDIEEEKNRLLSQMKQQEESRKWLKSSVALIQAKREDALTQAVFREEDARNGFFLKRHGFL